MKLLASSPVLSMMGRMNLFYVICHAVLALVAAGSVCAQTPVPADSNDTTTAVDKPGQWAVLPEDGTPWKHADTGLRFPQTLGSFRLHAVFKDARPEAGFALTYVMPQSDVKVDVVIFPCKVNVVKVGNPMVVVRDEHQKIMADLVAAAVQRGYVERSRSEAQEHAVPLWERGNLPMVGQTLDLMAAKPEDNATKPPTNQWVGLTLYRDYFVQINVQVPAGQVEQQRKQTDDLVTAILQCVREPAVVPEMLKLCRTYFDHPLTKEAREAADSLLAFSKESSIFEVILPGEALTSMLNSITATSSEAALDLLRAFVVGSSVVALQDGTADESLDEGARLLIEARGLLAKQGTKLENAFLDELAEAVNAKRAASFLKEKMRTAK